MFPGRGGRILTNFSRTGRYFVQCWLSDVYGFGEEGDAGSRGNVEEDAAIGGIGYGGYARKVKGEGRK